MPNYPFPKELWSPSRRLDTTCVPFSLRDQPSIDLALTPLLHGRNQDVWGPNAHEFHPERWFEMKEQVESPVGVYGNLYVAARGIWMGCPSVDRFPFVFPVLRSQEASEAAWAGGSRALIIVYVIRFSGTLKTTLFAASWRYRRSW